MNLDEWVDLVKNTIGSTDFKEIGVVFLREYFGRGVVYTDGTGDGGVDAWITLQAEPPVRAAAQFHAGKSEPWDKKLTGDVRALSAYRDSLLEDDPRRGDFGRLYFVCTQTPSAVAVERECQTLLADHGVVVRVFDARAVASCALQNRGELLQLIARRVPGYEGDARPLSNARDEAVAAFSFFHSSPAKYRQAVAKSGIATVLHQAGGELEQGELVAQTAQLLRLSTPSNIVAHAVRNLEREALIIIVADTVRATPALLDRTRTSIAITKRDERALKGLCIETVEPLVPKGTHHRHEVAARAVDAIFGDIGLLVREPIAERLAHAVDPSSRVRSKYDGEAFKRWRTVAHRIEQDLGTDRQGGAALEAVVRVIAASPFAKSLAAAELFLRLTEHDAQEYERVLEASAQQVMIDTSIAMPMICSLYDQVVTSWQTSVAAHTLYRSLEARGARCVVPSVYVEEIASHLLKARDYAEIVESEPDLERSANYFVAHYCSSVQNVDSRSRADYLRLLEDFGVKPQRGADLRSERRRLERSVQEVLRRYAFDIEPVNVDREDTPLPGERNRAQVVLEHDRAVVRTLRDWTRANGLRWLVCTADAWLRGVLNDLDVVALDSVGLADMLELVRPTDIERPLLSPVDLAMAIGEQEREIAANVWDEIVRIEGPGVSDRALVRKAREFRKGWLERRRDASEIDAAWTRYRDEHIEESSS